jgi:hypothetical protein
MSAFRSPKFIDTATNNNPRRHGWRERGRRFRATFRGWGFHISKTPDGMFAVRKIPPRADGASYQQHQAAIAVFNRLAFEGEFGAWPCSVIVATLDDAKAWVIGECRRLAALPHGANIVPMPAPRQRHKGVAASVAAPQSRGDKVRSVLTLIVHGSERDLVCLEDVARRLMIDGQARPALCRESIATRAAPFSVDAARPSGVVVAFAPRRTP